MPKSKPKPQVDEGFLPGDTIRLKPAPEPQTEYKRPPRVFGVTPTEPGVSLNNVFYKQAQIYTVVADSEKPQGAQITAKTANTFSELFEEVK